MRSLSSCQAKPEDTLDLCQILNNDLAATIAKYPKRFIGLGTLPMQAPNLAVQELRRCIQVRCMCVLFSHTHMYIRKYYCLPMVNVMYT